MGIGDEQQHQRGGRQEIAGQRALGRLVGIEHRSRRQAGVKCDGGAGDVQRREDHLGRAADEQAEHDLGGEQMG